MTKKKSIAWWMGIAASSLAAQSAAQTQARIEIGTTAQAATQVAAQTTPSGTAPDYAARDGDAAVVTVLNPVRVTGQQLLIDLPEGSTVTTRQQLDRRSINDWEDFSKRGEPSVNFSRQSNSVNIRGMDGDRVVTRVDGIRLPWLNDGARGEQGGLNSIDFNSLSSIDLVRAAGAPQSGSLVGYLDLRTLSPDDLLEPGKDFGALVKSRYDSADDSWGIDAALAGRLGQGGTSWLLQAGQRKGHELENMGERGGYGPDREKANPQDYTQQNVLLKLQHAWDGEHKVGLSGQAFRRRGTIDNRLQQGTTYPIGQYSTDTELTRQRVVLGYDFDSQQATAPLSHGDIKIYWQKSRQEGDQDSVRNPDGRGNISFGPSFPVGKIYGYGYPYGPYGRANSVQESGYGLISNWDGYLTGGSVQHHWAVGGEWYASRNRQASSGYDNCPDGLPPVPPSISGALGPRNCDLLHTNQSDMPEAKSRQWALWVQDEISWANGMYALTPALRFDSYRRTPQNGGDYAGNPNAALTQLPSSSGQRVSPSLLARYAPRETLSFYAKYGYGYRAPSATQLYMNYGAPGTYLRAGNPTLKPETSHGWELGMDIGDADLGARISAFDNRYRDFIDDEVALSPDSPEWNPAWAGQYPMGVTGSVNRSRVRIYGAELSAHWRVNPNWYSWGSLAWAHGRDQSTGRYLNSVAPLKAILALGYEADRWGAEAITTLVASRSNVEYPQATAEVSEPDFQAPGYGLLDLTAWWKPQAVKGVRLTAGVFNVFDKKYWNALDVPRPGGRGAAPLDSYTQPGRSLRVSLTYQY